jgi:RNA polymerase sigma-70 factor (ECF subfamily)
MFVVAHVAGPADYRHEDDNSLASLVAQGHGGAFEALYDRYGARCFGLARRLLTTGDLAEDVVQEVFAAVWTGAARFDHTRGSVSSWLLVLTHHKSVDAIRREERVRSRRTSDEALRFVPDDAPPADDDAVRRTAVRQALLTLPDAQREVMALAFYGGYTQQEIARLSNTPLGTVKTRMLGASRKLRLLLAEGEEVHRVD